MIANETGRKANKDRAPGHMVATRPEWKTVTFRGGRFVNAKAAFVGVITLVALFGSSAACPAADPPASEVPAGFQILVGALKASPGCLGVETARTTSGKLAIFAWFEDKKAALAWYNNPVHQQAMKRFLPDAKRHGKPLAGVPDDSGPIMAIASLTPNDKPTKENPSPFKQIAIELYQPLSGGLAIGGRFSPEKMTVPPRKEQPGK
jgi:hypothetical protein